ncbi:MAG: TetR family transcriptional regulator [Deltaproteobacteria bacterium]|nr:TetR family transcriptional regulator [Deltaproteobacteria bacterium]
MKTKAEPTPIRKRAVQQRAEDTRAAILVEAIELFSSRGFDGVSLRTIEANAGVQRGAIAYHFTSKDGLWRCAIDQVFARFVDRLEPLEATLRDLEPAVRLRTAIAAFVRFSAEVPELSRLMVQEGKQASWRLDYIVDTYMRPRQAWLTELVGTQLDAHTFYFVIGAAKTVFDVEHECRSLFGVDPTSDEFIREHATRLADLIQSAQKRTE